MPLQRRVTPSAQGAQGNQEPPSQGQGANEQEADQGLANLLAEHDNDPIAVAKALLKDNHKARERARKAEGRVRDAVVLSGDEAAAWEAYQKLGLPSDVAAKLRQGELERVAGKAGLNPAVFADLDRMAGGKLVYEARTEEVDGAQVERVYVKDGDTQAPLSDYAAAKWANYLPSLQPQAAGQGPLQGRPGGNGAATPAAPAPGLRFPAQHPGGGGAPVTTKTVAENTLNKAYAPRKPAAS